MPGEKPAPRGPTIATLRAIEEVLREGAGPMSRYQIRQALPTQIAAPLLDEALAYLAEHGWVRDEGPGGKVLWVREPPTRRQGSVPSSRSSVQPSGKPQRLGQLVRRHRREILALAAKHGVEQVRLFGSVARGEETKSSDVDLLIRLEPGRSLLDHIAFQQDVQDLLDTKVDVVSEGGVSPYIRDAVFHEAIAV